MFEPLHFDTILQSCLAIVVLTFYDGRKAIAAVKLQHDDWVRKYKAETDESVELAKTNKG